jgi:hypothetical protein
MYEYEIARSEPEQHANPAEAIPLWEPGDSEYAASDEEPIRVHITEVPA